jgi:invasion protein IalB
MMTKTFLAALMAATASTAGAQVSSIQTSNPAPKTGKPDKIVCETEEKTGSRLGARRVCLTVAQWAEKRREHREATEKVQRIVNMEPIN